MEFRVLNYFLAVAEEESFSKAAEKLHITQPTLSRQIADLEEELGVTLLTRSTRTITLTEEGEFLRKRAEEICGLVENTKKDLQSADENISGVITIGYGEIGAVNVLSQICRRFQRKYPQIRFDFYTSAAESIKEKIERGTIDIGLLLQPVDVTRFEFIHTGLEEEWSVLMRADDSLAKKEQIRAEDLIGVNVGLPGRRNVQSEIMNWFGEEGRHLQIAYTYDMYANMKIMVNSGLGYGICLPGSEVSDGGNLVSRPLDPPIFATSVLAWKRDQKSSRAVEKFIAFLKKNYEHRRDVTMIEKMVGKRDQRSLALISDITYSHAVYWFNNTMKPMKMSVILPKNRTYESPRPLLIWLCGGDFRVTDKDVWIPQLVYFAQQGYTVASIEYRTRNEGVFPDPIVDIKAAIRYLRANAKDFFVDPNRIILGGESAGACLSLLAAASDGITAFEQGEYLDQPSNVQAVLDFYGTAYLDYEHDIYPGGKPLDSGDPEIKLGEVPTMLSSKMPPVFIVHGDQDPNVPIEHSYRLCARLQELNVPCEMLEFEGAGHGADEFYQPEIFDRIIEFLDKVMP